MIKKILSLILMVLMIAPMAFANVSATELVPPCYAVTSDGQGEQIATKCFQMRPMIDVVFVIDSTGSMADEIRSVKTHIINLVDEVRSGQPSPKLRVGVVTYRDHQREENGYLYRKFKLTSDIEEALDFIRNIEANGGGDGPEAVADGLHVAVNKMNWDNNAKKLIFLIGDAAPHGVGSSDSSYFQGCPEGHNYKHEIETAREKGVTIYTISGSGMDYVGDQIWQTIAYETGGDYERLSYVRRVVEDYYQEEGIEEEWVVEEAKASADYDAGSNTILTNTLGSFAKMAVMSQAADMGVEYDDPVEPVDVELVDGYDTVKDYDEPIEDSKLSRFFINIFRKLTFWR